MTNEERRQLESEQNVLMELYAEIELDPERYSDNFQNKLDSLDDQADKIRWILEGNKDDV